MKIINNRSNKMTIKYKPSGPFVGASWAALGLGTFAFLIGLWNSEMELNEQGYYFAVLTLGLFSVVSLQKTIRDKLEDVPTTAIYLGICWAATGISLLLMTVGLWNAELTLSEKGFYLMAFALALFAAIVVQKNTRDTLIYFLQNPEESYPTSSLFKHKKKSDTTED